MSSPHWRWLICLVFYPERHTQGCRRPQWNQSSCELHTQIPPSNLGSDTLSPTMIPPLGISIFPLSYFLPRFDSSPCLAYRANVLHTKSMQRPICRWGVPVTLCLEVLSALRGSSCHHCWRWAGRALGYRDTTVLCTSNNEAAVPMPLYFRMFQTWIQTLHISIIMSLFWHTFYPWSCTNVQKCERSNHWCVGGFMCFMLTACSI